MHENSIANDNFFHIHCFLNTTSYIYVFKIQENSVIVLNSLLQGAQEFWSWTHFTFYVNLKKGWDFVKLMSKYFDIEAFFRVSEEAFRIRLERVAI